MPLPVKHTREGLAGYIRPNGLGSGLLARVAGVEVYIGPQQQGFARKGVAAGQQLGKAKHIGRIGKGELCRAVTVPRGVGRNRRRRDAKHPGGEHQQQHSAAYADGDQSFFHGFSSFPSA